MSGERRMAAAALLLSVFVAGAFGGVVGAKMLERRPWDRWEGPSPHMSRPSGMPGRPGPRGPDGWPRGFSPMMLSDRLAGTLELTEEQQTRVRQILEGRHARAAEVLEGIEPRLRAQLDSIRAEIRGILTPSQQEQFDRLMEQEEELFTRRMARPDSSAPLRR